MLRLILLTFRARIVVRNLIFELSVVNVLERVGRLFLLDLLDDTHKLDVLILSSLFLIIFFADNNFFEDRISYVISNCWFFIFTESIYSTNFMYALATIFSTLILFEVSVLREDLSIVTYLVVLIIIHYLIN